MKLNVKNEQKIMESKTIKKMLLKIMIEKNIIFIVILKFVKLVEMIIDMIKKRMKNFQLNRM